MLLNQELESNSEANATVSVLNSPNVNMLKKLVELLDKVLGPSLKPSIKEAPLLELKPLPSNLRYIFLCVNNTLPVILSPAQVETVVAFLKRRKRAIGWGWQMFDLYGISPFLCMHEIFIEEGHKLVA